MSQGQELAQGALQAALSEAATLERFAAGEATDQDREDYGVDETADILDVFDLAVLEVTDGGRTLVTGTGGPHTELRVGDRGDTVAVAYWGGTAAATVWTPALAELLTELGVTS